MSIKRAWLAVAAIACLLAAGTTANAYPYATSIRPDVTSFTAGVGSVTFSFIINHDADNASVEIVSAVTGTVFRTATLGPVTAGFNSFNWDGKDNANQNVPSGIYTAKITVSHSGLSATAWTMIPNIYVNVFSPKGVAVNKNPNSPRFGWVYIPENGGLTALGRLTQDGLYIHNADGSDAVGQGDAALATEAGWIASGNSPFRAFVSADDRVWICDWADAHSGVWVCDGDGLGVVSALDNSNQSGIGLNHQHGSVPCVWVEGSGASTVLYTNDEDFPGDPVNPTVPSDGSVWKFPVGTGPFPHMGAPTMVIDDVAIGDINQNLRNDMIRDKNGNWWTIQNRAGGATDTLPSLWKVSADGTTVQWASVPDAAPNSLADPLVQTYGLAYDPSRNRLVTTNRSTNAKLIVLDITSGVPDIANRVEITPYTGNNNDADFDVPGNLYVVNSTKEELSVWSPPGPSTFTTTGAVNVNVTGTGVEGDASGDGCVDDGDLTSVILDYGGPPSGSNGDTDVNNDGVVDDADITIVILNFGFGC